MARKSMLDRFRDGWNVFLNRQPTYENPIYSESRGGSYYRPDRSRMISGTERTIVASVITRIAIDVAANPIRHVKLDADGRYLETINSSLNQCLNLSANIDQTGKAFLQDAVMSLLDEGVVALVPVDIDEDPDTHTFKISTIRTGRIVEWYPMSVRVNVYNDLTGKREDVVVSKQSIAIIENPLYAVFNEPNSTLKRLINKLNISDSIDDRLSADKLDLLIQLPYTVRSEGMKRKADDRRNTIEKQLVGSKYGIAYIDGTERVTQLNRPVENTTQKQVEYLTSMLFSQLGMTQNILNGTASESELLAYTNRTVVPILSAIVDEMKRKFLSVTARTQNQSIEYFSSPFTLFTAKNLAEMADKFTRNEILTKNEIRQIMGYRPSNDPKADKLINANISQPESVVQEYSNEEYEDAYGDHEGGTDG